MEKLYGYVEVAHTKRQRPGTDTRTHEKLATICLGLSRTLEKWQNQQTNSAGLYIKKKRERESLDVVIYLWAAAPRDIYLRLGLER